MVNKKKKKQPYIIATSGILLLGLLSILIYRDISQQQKLLPQKAKPVSMTIFVHGTFGPMLGLLSFPKVVSDDLKGTLYRKVNKKMRKDPYFYQDQAIFTRGLHQLSPSFTPHYHKNKKLAAQPIAKAYQSIQQVVSTANGTHYFYTFGWSGLISQSKRRIDALRFYNCLIEEVNRLKKRHGKLPQIKVLAHSHGGNICLNLIGISKLLSTKGTLKPYTSHPNGDKLEALNKLYDLIKALPTKQDARRKNGLKDFDYQPTEKLPAIEELVLFGTPIQPETESFLTSAKLKNIYHFYSQQDFVQQLDWVSTKKFYSNQRLSQYVLDKNKDEHNVYQCRIMYEHEYLKKSLPKTEEESSFWGKIFSKSILFSKKQKDPTHKEMWFIMWRDEKKEDVPFLWPLPTVVLTPLLTALIKQQPSFHDVDLNITQDKQQLKVELSQHNSTTPQQQATLEPSFINNLKRKVTLWRPNTFTEKSSFNAVYKHLIHNDLLK